MSGSSVWSTMPSPCSMRWAAIDEPEDIDERGQSLISAGGFIVEEEWAKVSRRKSWRVQFPLDALLERVRDRMQEFLAAVV